MLGGIAAGAIMVKRFMQTRAGRTGNVNRYAPETEKEQPAFELITRKAVGPDEDELVVNPRSRSAKLRVARRTEAPAGEVVEKQLGMPTLGGRR